MSANLKTLMKTSKAIAATLALGAAATAANAGFITLNTDGLQQIYDQANIQIRYNASQTIFSNELLVIDDDIEFNSLSNYEVGGNTLSMFFVDAINFCGAVVPGIVGCASTPGTLITLDSGFVGSAPEGPTTMGHEVGHNLGLQHVDEVVPGVGDNLMNPATYVGNPAPLTQAQIDQILLSPLIQVDASNQQKYLSITPFAVVGAVPEPGSLALVLAGIALLGWRARSARQL